MPRTPKAIIAALAILSACSAPSLAPAPSVAAADPPAGTAGAAPAAMTGRARTCMVMGMHWQGSQTQISPTMTMSNDGFCGTHAHILSNVAALMLLESKPSHGQIETFGAGSAFPGFHYRPDQGYVGTDSFVMLTGNARHEVLATFSVTVTN